MIVIFPLLVSKNVNTNLVQGMAVTLEQYIAAYAISDFFVKTKEFSKYYDYKIKAGKLYQESKATYFDIDPATRLILEEQEALGEVIVDPRGNPVKSGRGGKGRPYGRPKPKPKPKPQPKPKKPNIDVDRSAGETAAEEYLRKKGVAGIDPEEELPEADPTQRGKKLDQIGTAMTAAQQAADHLQNWRRGKDKGGKEPIKKPKFTNATIQGRSISLEPTWIEVQRPDQQGTSRLGIKVIPMMIEGFNIKHTISMDMQKYLVGTFITQIGRKIMRLLYRFIDKWTFYGQRPRGDVRHDMFYARTGHDGQPFVLLDKNDDIPKVFFSQPQNMLKLWRMSWGNLLIADDATKTVMFCMKKYKGMCSNFTYSMLFSQSKEMARVFEDMEDAKKATSSLFRFNKKITQLGGRR